MNVITLLEDGSMGDADLCSEPPEIINFVGRNSEWSISCKLHRVDFTMGGIHLLVYLENGERWGWEAMRGFINYLGAEL